MARVTYKYQPLTVRVDVAGVTFPATLASRVEYSEAQDDYVWGMDVQLNATSGAVPILEDGDVVTLWPPVRDPVQLTIAPVSSDQFRLQGTGYPLFLSPDDPPEGRDRPSEESVMAGLEHRSVAYIIQDGRIRGDLLQHINAVLARLEEAEPEDEWEKELIAQATALATELRELISSERPASEYLADRSHSQRLIGGLMNFARLVEAKGGAALAKTPIVNAVLQLGQKATEVSL